MCKAVRFAAVVAVMFLGTMMFAQGINDVYQVNYFSNNLSPYDQHVRIINTGQQGTPISTGHGTVCADVYSFDNTQEMLECCSCPITANGIIELSLHNDLMQNPLTGIASTPNSGVIKIVSDNRANCNETSPVPVPNVRAWGTHIQRPWSNNQVQNGLVVTETEFLQAPLQADELSFLGQACSFVQYLGSGKGVCRCGNSPS